MEMMIRSACRFEPRRGRARGGRDGRVVRVGGGARRRTRRYGFLSPHAITRFGSARQSETYSSVERRNSLSFLRTSHLAKGRAHPVDDSSFFELFSPTVSTRGNKKRHEPPLRTCRSRPRVHSDAALDTMGCGASAPVSAATPVEKAPEGSTGTTRAPPLPRRDRSAPSTCLIRAPTDASLTDTPSSDIPSSPLLPSQDARLPTRTSRGSARRRRHPRR